MSDALEALKKTQQLMKARAEARRKELDREVLGPFYYETPEEGIGNIIHEYGMERTLIALLASFKDEGEPYLVRLRQDLTVALDNYNARYEGENG